LKWCEVLVVTWPHRRAAIGVSHAAATVLVLKLGSVIATATRDGMAVMCLAAG